MPLWLVVVRYFIYCIAAIGALALALIMGFSILMNMEVVYPANYGATHADETLDRLSEQTTFDASAIPSAYWYAHISNEGDVLETDMNERQLSVAVALVQEGRGLGTAEPASDYDLYTAIQPRQLADGSWCALGYELAPQFTSRELRDALPNPQNMLVALAALLAVAILVAFAVRASRVITRKMQPLVDAAEAIGRQELDFTVGASNVRQVNVVLGAMENMRASLAASLEAQWRAEEAQRAQVAALAHDLKTPLTVVEANADYLAEDTRLAGDAREAAHAVASGARRLNDAVQAVIEAARGQVAPPQFAATEVHAFAIDVTKRAEEFAKTAGARIVAETALPHGAMLDADRTQLERAVMNLVSNAVEHSPIGGNVRISFAMEDTADGVTPYMGDATAERAKTSMRDPSDNYAAIGKGEIPGEREGSNENRKSTATVPPNAHDANAHDAHDDANAPSLLLIIVDDEGPGFSPAALEHGCERFFREDEARSQAGLMGGEDMRKGGVSQGPHASQGPVEPLASRASTQRDSAPHYGIGLATAFDIVHAHGGALTLENRIDESGGIAGARVTLCIPMRR